jgi:hypothetical protein
MLVEIQEEGDLQKLETAILEMLGAERLDVSVLRSKPYIDLRQNVLKILQGKDEKISLFSTYFNMEDLVLRVVSSSPILVWCDKKEAVPTGSDEP